MNGLGLFAVEPSKLPSVNYWVGRKHLPTSPGIYFVIRHDGIVVYVGQASSLKKRWAGVHHAGMRISRRAGDHKIHYLECNASDLNDYEAYFIHKHIPPLNVVYPSVSSIHELIQMTEAGAISYKEAFEFIAVRSMDFAERVEQHIKKMAQMDMEKDALHSEIIKDLSEAFVISLEMHKARTESRLHTHN